MKIKNLKRIRELGDKLYIYDIDDENEYTWAIPILNELLRKIVDLEERLNLLETTEVNRES